MQAVSFSPSSLRAPSSSLRNFGGRSAIIKGYKSVRVSLVVREEGRARTSSLIPTYGHDLPDSKARNRGSLPKASGSFTKCEALSRIYLTVALSLSAVWVETKKRMISSE
jgi:hypothetical protein